MQEIRKFDPDAEVEVTSENNVTIRVDNSVIPRIIGKEGSMVNHLEERLGVHIEIEPKIPALGREVNFGMNESGNSLEFLFDKRLVGKIASVYVEDEFLFSATIGKKGNIKIGKSSEIGEKLINAVHNKRKVKVLI